MARNLYPSLQVPASAAGSTVAVYTDAGLTTLADVSLGPSGPSLAGSLLTVTGAQSTPMMYGPDGFTGALYVSSGGAQSVTPLTTAPAPTAAGSSVAGVKTCVLSGGDAEVPTGSGLYLPFALNSGSADIFDLTDPENPLTLGAGLLSLSGWFQTDNNTEGDGEDKWVFAELDLDADGVDPYVQATISFPEGGLRGGELPLAINYYVPAGSRLSLFARHDATGTARCFWKFAVTFIPLDYDPRL